MASFVDHVKITARAGAGGNGCVSFHREKFIQNGGPDGGDGGNGGSVILLADPNMHTLLDFRFHTKYEAEAGVDGLSNKRDGKTGADLVVKVPVGTVVFRDDTGDLVADMHEAGQQKTLLAGGRGGFGNSHFATPTRQAPNFAKPGVKTLPYTFRLELKTIADVGLVGFPNVGKSTLLSVMTAAKPKIANYHFTTLQPNLGIARRFEREFVMADIPGLVEGASEGVGLGHDFLRHVERTRLLLHVLDAAGSEDRDPLSDYSVINRELSRYGDLRDLPQIVVLNKCDLLPADDESIAQLTRTLEAHGACVRVVSAAMRVGLDALADEIVRQLDALPPVRVFEETDDLAEAAAAEASRAGFEVTREGDAFVLAGPSVDHLIASVNFGDEESVRWFQRVMRKAGMIDALRAKGAGEGATVRMADMEFDFIE